ncbi:hypothetical protein LCGC14_0843280 [marine sediment metagenome]|uniref:Uncharacterized protein n=1 Tax=marine sediment metagenome TaxID=412755 RepID=A0A0F9RX43_9ZZZZ
MSQHPTEEILNITRKFLGGELGTPGVAPESQQVGGRQLPRQAAPVAGRRAFGQQGARQRRGGDLAEPLVGRVPSIPVSPPEGASLSDSFFNLPGPVGFAQTPQGQAILQRILSGVGRRGLR